MSNSLVLTTSEFLSCNPIPTVTATATVTDTYIVEYCVTLLAACPTSTWTAIYTVEEECTGNSATWTTPSTLNNFVETTVICEVCDKPTMVVTCPVASPTGNCNITGNGITATPSGASTGMVLPMPGTSTGASLPVVTAGAPSLRKSLTLMVGAAMLAGSMFLS